MSHTSADWQTFLDTWALPQGLLGNIWSKRLHAYDAGLQRDRARQPDLTHKGAWLSGQLWEEPWYVSQAGEPVSL